MVHVRNGLRGVRVGEASHPGPALLRRLRRRRDVPFEISSDEEPLVRGIARNVVPRVDGLESVIDATQVSLATVPATQTALVEAGIELHSEVVLLQSHRTFLDSLEEDLDRVDGARSPEFVVPVLNRFALLDSTASDTESLIFTALDGSGVEADDAPVQIHMEPSRPRPHRRLALVLHSQGTLGSIPAQSDDVSSRRALRMMQFPAWLAATILRRMSNGCRGTDQLGVADSHHCLSQVTVTLNVLWL